MVLISNLAWISPVGNIVRTLRIEILHKCCHWRQIGAKLQYSLLVCAVSQAVLWSPYVIGQTIIYFHPVVFSSFFPRLISAVRDWIHTWCGLSVNLGCRSETCCTRPPFPSNRYHRRCGDCLEGKGENYQVCSVQYCVQQLCTVRCTHIWTD